MNNLTIQEQAAVLIAIGTMMRNNSITMEQVVQTPYRSVFLHFLLHEGLELKTAMHVINFMTQDLGGNNFYYCGDAA